MISISKLFRVMSGKCIARKWKGENGTDGIGSRCNRPCKIGEFCGIHGKNIKNSKICKEPRCSKYNQIHIYAWEHLGRCDEVLPSFFTQEKTKLDKSKLETPKSKLETPKSKSKLETPKSKSKSKSKLETPKSKSKSKLETPKSKDKLKSKSKLEKDIKEEKKYKKENGVNITKMTKLIMESKKQECDSDSWSSDDDYDLGEEDVEKENIKYEGVKSTDGKFYFLDKKTNIVYLDYDGKKSVGKWDEKKKMPIKS